MEEQVLDPSALTSGWITGLKQASEGATPQPPAATPAEPAGGTAQPKPETTPEPKPEEKPPRTSAEWKKYLENKNLILAEKAASDARATSAEKLAAEKDAQFKAIQAQMAELEKRAVPPPDYEDLKKRTTTYEQQVKEYEDRLRRVDLQNDPRFKAAYDGKIDTIIKTTLKMVPADKQARVAALLAAEPTQEIIEALSELTSEMSPVVAGTIGSSLQAITGLRSERQAELENNEATWKAKLEADKALEQAQAKQAREEAERFLDVQLKSLRQEEGFKFATDEDERTVKRMLAEGPKTVEEAAARVRLGMQAVLYKGLLSQLIESNKALTALQEEVKALKVAQPSAGGAPASSRSPSAIEASTAARFFACCLSRASVRRICGRASAGTRSGIVNQSMPLNSRRDPPMRTAR